MSLKLAWVRISTGFRIYMIKEIKTEKIFKKIIYLLLYYA
jgi:hypothetical protein